MGAVRAMNGTIGPGAGSATQDMTRSLVVVSSQNGTVVSETQSLQADSQTLHAQVAESLSIVDNLTAMAQNLKGLAARSDSTH